MRQEEQPHCLETIKAVPFFLFYVMGLVYAGR